MLNYQMVNGIHQNKKNEILQIFRIFPEKIQKNRHPPTGELAGGAFSGGFTAGGSLRGVFPVVAKSKC